MGSEFGDVPLETHPLAFFFFFLSSSSSSSSSSSPFLHLHHLSFLFFFGVDHASGPPKKLAHGPWLHPKALWTWANSLRGEGVLDVRQWGCDADTDGANDEHRRMRETTPLLTDRHPLGWPPAIKNLLISFFFLSVISPYFVTQPFLKFLKNSIFYCFPTVWMSNENNAEFGCNKLKTSHPQKYAFCSWLQHNFVVQKIYHQTWGLVFLCLPSFMKKTPVCYVNLLL